MNVLVVDIGGTNLKVPATAVKRISGDLKYDVVSVGFQGRVFFGKPISEPRNLGKGRGIFDYEAAFKRPVQIVNVAAMQALGSYKKGKTLFL